MYEYLVKYTHRGERRDYMLPKVLAEYPNTSKNGGIYMNVYTTDKIRNVVLLGHGGCGKTSLAEAMAYLSGTVARPHRGSAAKKSENIRCPLLRKEKQNAYF